MLAPSGGESAAGAVDLDGDGDGGGGEAEAVAVGLKAERMNRTVSLSECSCIRHPRIVSYADVGDPNGFVVSQSASQ